MIPAPFFLGFNTFELLIFEVIQTLINFVLVLILLKVVFIKLLTQEIGNKKLITTAIYVEICNIISSFLWYYLVLYAIAGFPLLIIVFLCLPYFAIYFNFVNDQEVGPLSPKDTLKVHLLVSVPAVIISSILSSIILNLIGISNFFFFS